MIKTTTLLATLASVALLSVAPVDAMESFLAKIPNGSLFGKWLGHTDDGYTAFGNDFSSEFEWTERLCKLNFAGAATKMTYGEAFGDPCCTWKVGATPQTITAWTQGGAPTKATVCASAATPTVTSAAPATAPASTTKAPASTTKAPASTTKAPASTTKAPASTTKAPASSTTPKPSSKKCTKKAKRL